MNRRSIVGVLVPLLVLCSVATAQQIVEKSNPALGGWQVSISQKFAPGVFKHSATFKTLAEARADAKRRIAQNPSKGNEWDLHTVLIEGGDPKPKKAEPENKDGGKKDGDLLTRLRDAKDAADRAVQSGKEDLARAIRDYKQAVEDAYRRIKDFEKDLVGGTQELQERRFQEINSLVDRYNRQVTDFQSVMGPSAPFGYKPLPRFQAPSPPVPAEAAASKPADAGSLVGRTWSVTEIKGGDHYNNRGEKVAGRPLAVEFRAGGAATGIYNSDEHSGTWSENDGIVTIRLNSYGRRGYSSYREGFRIRGRRNPDGSIQVLEWAQDVP